MDIYKKIIAYILTNSASIVILGMCEEITASLDSQPCHISLFLTASIEIVCINPESYTKIKDNVVVNEYNEEETAAFYSHDSSQPTSW